VTPLPRPGKAARARLALAIGLGVTSIAGSALLAAADIIRGTVTWAHHSPASAAPLFLIAAAIAAVSIGSPPEGRHGLLRLVAVLAFTAWGTGQVTPSPAAAGALNDAAILLFATDGGYAVTAEARAILARYRHTAQATPAPARPHTIPPRRGAVPPHANRAHSHRAVMLRKIHATVHLRRRLRTSLTVVALPPRCEGQPASPWPSAPAGLPGVSRAICRRCDAWSC
jgi:hypothetical protein